MTSKLFFAYCELCGKGLKIKPQFSLMYLKERFFCSEKCLNIWRGLKDGKL